EEIRQMKQEEYYTYLDEVADYDWSDNRGIFHENYQRLSPTRKVQVERLTTMGIQLCSACLIPCQDQFCDDCWPEMIPVPNEEWTDQPDWFEEVEEQVFGTIMDYPIPANFQGYEPIKPKKITKRHQNNQTIKYYNHKKEGIKPEKAHPTNAEFDLRYPGKKPLILKPHTVTKIDLKIAVEVPKGTMMQLAS
ncbi:12739_t:CDS:1, partial [Ambispora gerdemannii]